MGSETQKQIPKIDLSKEIERGSEEWNELCKRVREACEEFGCFEAIYDKIPTELREEVFSLTKELFELPLQIKEKNINPNNPYNGYITSTPARPLLESLGIGDASNSNSVKAFSHLLLSDPIAQHHFCQSFSSMVKHQNELLDTIWSLILDSFGIQKTAESVIPSTTIFRMLKYKPPRADGTNIGVLAHNDPSLCTLLCEHQCSGLELQIKDSDEWIRWIPNPNSHIFIVGDALVAWTNGRFHAVNHQVIMRENKDRFTIVNFLNPDDGVIIKPQKEFIDENHPQKYKEFDYSKFSTFVTSNLLLGDKLYTFAGI